MSAKKSKHGGRRTPGPGKRLGAPTKANAKQTLALRVPPSIRDYLHSTGNASVAVEEIVARSAGYRAWAKDAGRGK